MNLSDKLSLMQPHSKRLIWSVAIGAVVIAATFLFFATFVSLVIGLTYIGIPLEYAGFLPGLGGFFVCVGWFCWEWSKQKFPG